MIRTALAIGTAGLVLLTVAGPATSAPGPTEAGLVLNAMVPAAATQPAEIVNDEVVLAELDASGLPERAILISRTTVQGPEREVIDPASGTNVRYLDRLGRPEVGPDGVVLVVGGDRTSALTEARFDKPLPVAVHAEYAVDGSVVPAAAVPGTAGEVTVTYTLTNTTSEQTNLTYTDAAGQEQESEQPVFIPFQGTLTVTLPEGADLVEAPGAMLATDEQGRTVARWNISLFPPISTPIQEVALTMRDDRAGVPGAKVVLTPAGTDQDPATGFSSDLLTGANEGNGQLYEGLDALDAAAGELALGSEQLATGLAGLAGGATAAAGASESLAKGVGGLADGAETAADASTSLAKGVGRLADGADDVSAGSEKLAGALGEAATGAQDLAEATAALAKATSGSPSDQIAPLITGGAQIEAGLLTAAARIGGPADPVLDITKPLTPDGDNTCPTGGTAPPDDDCVTIYQGVRALRDGLKAVDEVVGKLEGRVDETRDAFAALVAALGSIKDDVTEAAQGAQELFDSLCVAVPPATDPILDPASCDQIQAVIAAAESALGTAGGALPDIKDLVAAIVALEAQAKALSTSLDYALASTERLLLGVEAVGLAVGTGTPTQPGPGHRDGRPQRRIAPAVGPADHQPGRAQQGPDVGGRRVRRSWPRGIDSAATGADALAEGSDQLAEGAQGAASGAEALAAGPAAARPRRPECCQRRRPAVDRAVRAGRWRRRRRRGRTGPRRWRNRARAGRHRTCGTGRPRRLDGRRPRPGVARGDRRPRVGRPALRAAGGCRGQRRLRVQPRRGPGAALVLGAHPRDVRGLSQAGGRHNLAAGSRTPPRSPEGASGWPPPGRSCRPHVPDEGQPQRRPVMLVAEGIVT